jgi:hypothetical protein
MDKDNALENLQTIRTLMERSALYRRALAPVMLLAGTLGMLAATAGVLFRIESEPGFIGYWMGVALAGLTAAFLLVRRQALKSAEAFWSPPTRRVASALLPCLMAGLMLGIWFYLACPQPEVGDPPAGMAEDRGPIICLVGIWSILYGCALHAAGFFTLKGLRQFGWLFIAAGVGVLFILMASQRQDYPAAQWLAGHWIMGGLFGLLQLAYGIYLKLTGEEQAAL